MYKSILLVAVQYKLKHLTREKIGIKNKPKKKNFAWPTAYSMLF